MSPTYTKSKKAVQDNVVRNNTTGVVQRQYSQQFSQEVRHNGAQPAPISTKPTTSQTGVAQTSTARAQSVQGLPKNIPRANQPHTTPPTHQPQSYSYSKTSSTYQSQSTQNAQQNQYYSSSTWQYTQTTQPTQDQKRVAGQVHPNDGARAGGKPLVKQSSARRVAGK